MELRQYIAILIKWSWLIILTVALAAGSAYFHSQSIRPTYRAETTVLIGRVVENPNPSINDVQSAYNLGQAYALLATQPPVLQATAEAIQWTEPWQTLYFKISAKAVGNQLLQISATDEDPHQAKVIADEVSRQLFLQGPIGAQQKQAEEQRTFVSAQLSQLKLQIESNQKVLTNLNNQAALENNPTKLNELNTRISALQSKIDTWQSTYANLSAILNNSQSLFLSVLVPAAEPTSPASPNISQNVVFAIVLGLLLSGAAILLLEYLDDTVKSAEDIQRLFNLSALGAITRIGGIRQPADLLITVKHPRSPISEGYRVLRTNLRFSGLENPSGALLVTSANPGEGKTTTAANLAVILAQTGRRVILLDADLRRPSIHSYFGLSNNVGLSSLFLGDTSAPEQVLQATPIQGLRVLTSGPLPPNPAELLDSKQMTQVLQALRAASDILILDSPPVLAVADPSILGSRCSGAILIVDAGHTRTDVCRRAIERLKQTNVRVFGVVLNKLSQGRASGYYAYYYRSGDAKTKENGQEKRAS